MTITNQIRPARRSGLAIPEWFALGTGMMLVFIYGAGSLGEFTKGSLEAETSSAGALGRQNGSVASSNESSGDQCNSGSGSSGSSQSQAEPPKFSVYNWDVSVGQTLNISTIIASGSLSGFELRGDERFTKPFMRGETVWVAPGMVQSGDHGMGEYRIHLLDGTGKEIDHFTIRIR